MRKLLVFIAAMALLPLGINAQRVSKIVSDGDTVTVLSDTLYFSAAQIGDDNATVAIKLSDAVIEPSEFGVDSMVVISIDGDDVLVLFNGTDTIMSYIPYAYRSSGALESKVITAEKDTLILTDASKFIYMDRATADTLLIPTNASVAFPIDTEIMIMWYGAGTPVIASQTSDVHLNGSAADSTSISAQFKPVCLKKKATNEWVIFGGL